MKTVLICHEGAALDEIGLARWLNATGELAGIIVLRENSGRFWKRVRREIKRSGFFRFADVMAFRLYYKIFLAKQDREFEQQKLEELCKAYPQDTCSIPHLMTHSPNSAEAEEFLRELAPDLMIARCKSLLKERIFSIPRKGTWVMHPGMCPEYRNAHGCFWALANDEREKVAMTLLKVDKGVDTGPVYGYFGCEFDEVNATHNEIQNRTVFDNLDEIRSTFEEIMNGTAKRIDTSGRLSATWGQPWLSKYLKWKSRAKKRNDHARELTPVS